MEFSGTTRASVQARKPPTAPPPKIKMLGVFDAILGRFEGGDGEKQRVGEATP